MTGQSITTRKGDDGSTSLLYGQRVPKSHPQIEAVGTLDELNVALGAVKMQLDPRDASTGVFIASLQQNLVTLMGEIACAEKDIARYEASKFSRLQADDLTRIDERIALLEAAGLVYDGWATPGANPRAAALDTARVTARRAERRLAELPNHGRNPRPLLLQYINRLSDLLWLLARQAETVQ
ncbi:MAG: cob(I)yrinic acid a,c-diamide adenosyltransferase [Cephaloticoccus sp.]|nr:cob(I)yrinic acid a,c-diamide adenosyltransferase [Cephaloticoccus sp.]MCF7759046.1 cob(I)yrinic acid a,c-diamide adenosyltransferase [Cephaloticoccus sp.]